MKSLISILVIATIAFALISMPSIIHNVSAKQKQSLTVILKLKYGLPDGKYYKKVVLRIADDYEKTFNWSNKPSKITIKGLNIPEGKTFNVNVDNYGTDDGEQIKMKNSKCKCPETAVIRIP